MSIVDNPGPDEHRSPRTSQRLRWAQRILLALAGAMLTLLVLGILLMVRRGPLAPLNSERLQAAEQRWVTSGIRNYDIEIHVSGRQASVYRVEVRDGQPQQATRNNEPLGQRRTWFTWTVPGMFETLRADLRNLEGHAAGQKELPRLTVQVQFDSQYGYPKRYVRVEAVQMGGNPEVTWEVTAFRPVP